MKKMFFAAIVIASLAACGGKKTTNTMNTGSGSAPAAGSDMGSGDTGSGSGAPEGGGSAM